MNSLSLPASCRPSAPHHPFSVHEIPWLLALVALLACGVPAAHAQTPPARLPSGAEPGRESPRPVIPAPALETPQIKVPQSSVAEVPPGAKDLRFVLKDFSIEGATAFPAAVLQPLYAGLVGREVSVAEMFEAANALELLYRNAGYVTSRVIVPPQTVENGQFRVVVVEGFIADIIYQDELGPARAAVEKLLNGLRKLRPVSIGEIERRLLLANDLHGLTVRGALEPSPNTPGGSVIVVRSVRKAFDGGLKFDSRVTRYFGEAKMTGNLAWNAIGERADRVWLTASSSLEVGGSADFSLGYDAQVADNGTVVSLTASHSRSAPGLELEPLNVESQVNSLLGTVVVPLIRSRGGNLRAEAQFEVRNVDTDLADVSFTRDRLRILRAGLDYDLADRWNGITAIRGMVHQGLSGLDASSNDSALASRPDGRSEFTKFTLDLTRLQQVTERFSVLASLTSQFSATRLLASEEFGLGGANFGRAFDDGAMTADNGLAGTLELRYVPAGLPRDVQIYGFVDDGFVWADDGRKTPSDNWLGSFGGGVRAKLSSTFFSTLEVATPIERVGSPEGERGARVFGSIQAQF